MPRRFYENNRPDRSGAVAIIALVAGVTYLSHYGPSAARSGETTPDAAKNDKPAAQPEDFAIITVPNRKVEWMEPSEGDFEMGCAATTISGFRTANSLRCWALRSRTASAPTWR